MMTEAEVEAKIQKVLDKGVSKLDLSNCNLAVLPESIGKLTKLQELELRNNRFQSLPESIGNLTQLESLTLEWNCTTVIFHALGLHRCSSLQGQYRSSRVIHSLSGVTIVSIQTR
jgi:Leucine-rich repeat (LRR) protein